MISLEQFATFVEEILLNEVALFIDSNSRTFDEVNRMTILSYGLFRDGETDIPSGVKHYIIDAPGSMTLKIFFLRKGNETVHKNLPFIDFHINFSGKLMVTTKLTRRDQPTVVFQTENLSELEPSHIHSFLINQFTNQSEN